ncbi:MAG: MATE family efflux transporter [Oscillospiraceae bacterium]|nr:MATE family efflux transporter [Oscillospiraceae bacterium]
MKDLTRGRPIKLIAGFALPILLGNLFQQAYNLADLIIIGQNLGNDSIAAVGSVTPLVTLMFNIIIGLVTGFAIIVARNFGAEDYDEMRRTIARMMVFSAALTLVITVAVTVFIEPLLNLLALEKSGTIFGEAKDYLFIVGLGLAATLAYNLEAAVLRAVGDSVIPLIILMISTFLNIGFDLLFVAVLGMGVTGAALATVSAQVISAVVCLIYLIKRRPMLLVKKRDFVFTAKSSKELLSAGAGMALMYSIVDLGTVVLQNSINGFGDGIIAAHTAARKLFSLIVMPLSAVCATLITYCSQNLGAGKLPRIKKGIRDGLLIMYVWAGIAIALIYLFGDALAGILIADADSAEGADIINTTVLYLRWNVPFFLTLVILLGLRSSLQGLGKSSVPIICSIMELSWKIITVLVMVPMFGGKNGTVGGTEEQVGGYFGIILSEPIIWTVCAIFIGIIAMIELRRLDKNLDNKERTEKDND